MIDSARLNAVRDLRDACERILAGPIMGKAMLDKAEEEAARLAKTLFGGASNENG